MTGRKSVAVVILALWVGALGLLAQKQLFPDEEKRREQVALLIEPVSYYYLVEWNGQHIGYASSQVDTSFFGIRLRNSVVTDPPDTSWGATNAVRFTALLSPQMRLRDFEAVVGRGSSRQNRKELFARSVGDSALELRYRSGAGTPADTVPFSRNAVVPEVAPFFMALARVPSTGESHKLEVFDRGTNTLTAVSVRIEAESLFVVADSAARDTVTGRYAPAHNDTVRAWKADLPGEGGGVTWFDRTGRIVMQQLPGGMTLRRTAFEIAFENWRMARDITEPPPAPPPGGSSRPGNSDRSRQD